MPRSARPAPPTMSTAEQRKVMDEINEEDLIELAKTFLTITEIAALYGVEKTAFWHRFREPILRGYIDRKAELKNTIMQKALNGERWALERVATSILGFKDEGWDMEEPVEQPTKHEPEDLTAKLKRVA